MLVLTRKTDQRIYIGDDITVTVVKVKWNSVQLGLEAPRGMRILRGELKGGAAGRGLQTPSHGPQTTATAPRNSPQTRQPGLPRMTDAADQSVYSRRTISGCRGVRASIPQTSRLPARGNTHWPGMRLPEVSRP